VLAAQQILSQPYITVGAPQFPNVIAIATADAAAVVKLPTSLPAPQQQQQQQQQQQPQPQQQQQQLQQLQRLPSVSEPPAMAAEPQNTAAALKRNTFNDKLKRMLSAKYLLKAVAVMQEQQQQKCGADTPQTVATTLAVLKHCYSLHSATLPPSAERAAAMGACRHAASKLQQCKEEACHADDAAVLECWTQTVQQNAQLAAQKLKQVIAFYHYILIQCCFLDSLAYIQHTLITAGAASSNAYIVTEHVPYRLRGHVTTR
jgi:hypothetical protein